MEIDFSRFTGLDNYKKRYNVCTDVCVKVLCLKREIYYSRLIRCSIVLGTDGTQVTHELNRNRVFLRSTIITLYFESSKSF